MAEYDLVLLRSVTAFPPSESERRHAIYQTARNILQDHLRNAGPPLAETDIAPQERALEEAIARVEAQVTKKPVLSASVPTPEDRVKRVGQGSWLTDILARASVDDAPAPPPAEQQPQEPEQQPSVVPFLRRSTEEKVKLGRGMPTSRLDDLNKILRKLQSESPGVEASALISDDGLMIASSLAPDMEEMRGAGMAATLQNLGGRAAVELARGKVQEIIVRGDRGYAVMINAGHNALLLALADEASKLGVILFDMLEAIKDLEKVLASRGYADSDREDDGLSMRA